MSNSMISSAESFNKIVIEQDLPEHVNNYTNNENNCRELVENTYPQIVTISDLFYIVRSFG